MFNFNHLKEGNQNYFQHGLRSFRLSIILIFLSIVALIHALIPFVFYNTASSWIKDINKEIQDTISV